MRELIVSLNLFVISPDSIFCASDRRIVGFLSGQTQTNRSTKTTIFSCADAHGVVAYNGIGMDDAGNTPSSWLLRLQERANLFDHSLSDVISGIRTDLELRVRAIRAKYGKRNARHTYRVGVWQGDKNILYCVSNYERAGAWEPATEGADNVTTTIWPATREKDVRIVAGGAQPRRARFQAIADAAKSGSLDRLIASSTKAIRDIAFGRGKARGAVGATCQWARLGPTKEQVLYGVDVAGGTIALEPPNLINIAAEMRVASSLRVRIGAPGVLIKDAFVGDTRSSRMGQYNFTRKCFDFSEPPCPGCGAPKPASHCRCELCLYNDSAR
jgi:hypothetical protein